MPKASQGVQLGGPEPPKDLKLDVQGAPRPLQPLRNLKQVFPRATCEGFSLSMLIAEAKMSDPVAIRRPSAVHPDNRRTTLGRDLGVGLCWAGRGWAGLGWPELA